MLNEILIGTGIFVTGFGLGALTSLMWYTKKVILALEMYKEKTGNDVIEFIQTTSDKIGRDYYENMYKEKQDRKDAAEQ